MAVVLVLEPTTLYEIRGEIDQTEGRGGTRLIGYTRHFDTAREYAKGKGVMGLPGKVLEKEGFILFHEHDAKVYGFMLQSSLIAPEDLLCSSAQKAKEREEALAKLTDRERKLLGL